MGWLLFLAVVIASVVAWRMRVQILSTLLGQPEDRVRRQITHKRD